ncbi:hypothetical protein ACQP1G_34230 [Nocardia sp. CA-107356]|uniref:hypothetical protein n=1 Tax=Nocardia sp. CA-107356 TaxID=3239972 RepID=UPI003D8A2F02
MSTNRTPDDPILPVPSELYEDLGEVQERVEELYRDLARIRRSYEQLSRSPESLRVDDLGSPTTPLRASAHAQEWLTEAASSLRRTHAEIDTARGHGSRLALTDAACEHRDKQPERQRCGDRCRTR